MPGAVWNKAFRRDIIERHALKFHPALRFREDEDFVMKYLLCVRRVLCLECAAYKYYMPNLSDKYSRTDNFELGLSLLQSADRLFSLEISEQCALHRTYLVQSLNAFFYGFEHLDSREMARRYARYRPHILPCLNEVADLSGFTKRVFRGVARPRVACFLFRCKQAVSHLLHQLLKK